MGMRWIFEDRQKGSLSEFISVLSEIAGGWDGCVMFRTVDQNL